MFSDGLTCWSKGELGDWASLEGMTEVDAESRFWAGMSLSYNPDSDVDPPPITFAILGQILRYSRSYNYRVCEWRPCHFAVAGVLENWGAPVFIDHVMGVGIHDLLARMESRPLSAIGDNDIFCSSLTACHGMRF